MYVYSPVYTFKALQFFKCMYMIESLCRYVCALRYLCPWRPEALDLPEAGVTESCEPLNMGVANWTWVLFKNSLTLNHWSTFPAYIYTCLCIHIYVHITYVCECTKNAVQTRGWQRRAGINITMLSRPAFSLDII